MTTNTNNTNATSFRYLGKVAPGAYTIEAIAKGKRKGATIASFTTYDAMLQAWVRITDLCNMIDVNGSKFD